MCQIGGFQGEEDSTVATLRQEPRDVCGTINYKLEGLQGISAGCRCEVRAVYVDCTAEARVFCYTVSLANREETPSEEGGGGRIVHVRCKQ